MKILPLAFDSFGVRSMSMLVECNKLKIIIDLGVALGPKRYGLAPTKEELKALELSKQIVWNASKEAEVAIVTHYHYDHHPYPNDEKLYGCFKGKTVLAKDIAKNINFSGKRRGKIFEEKVKGIAKSVQYADGKEFEFDDIHISFSPAVWHGDVGSKVGTVIMVFISSGKDSFLFGSDAQSLADQKALEWVKERNPRFLVVDGYPTIFLGWKFGEKSFLAAKNNLKEAIEKIEAKEFILDHHIVRDVGYKERMKDVFEFAEGIGKKIFTAAEFLGLENFFLEAWRKEIHESKKKLNVESYFKELRNKPSKKI